MKFMLALALLLSSCSHAARTPLEPAEDPNIRELDMIQDLASISPEQKEKIVALHRQAVARLKELRLQQFQAKGQLLQQLGAGDAHASLAGKRELARLEQAEVELVAAFLKDVVETVKSADPDYHYIYRALLREDRRSGAGLLR